MYQKEIDRLYGRIDELEDSVDSKFNELITLKNSIEKFSAMLATSNQQSAEIIVLYSNIRSFLKVMGVIRTLAEWVVKVAAASTIVWLIIKYGITDIIDEYKRLK